MEIKSRQDLLKVFDSLHDTHIKENDITYNNQSHILNIIVSRDYLEDKSLIEVKRIIPFIRKYSYPLMKTQVRFENVTFFDMKSKDSSLREHTFNNCLIKNNLYILRFSEVLRIEISFFDNLPVGFMKDIELDRNLRGHFLSFSWKP